MPVKHQQFFRQRTSSWAPGILSSRRFLIVEQDFLQEHEELKEKLKLETDPTCFNHSQSFNAGYLFEFLGLSERDLAISPSEQEKYWDLPYRWVMRYSYALAYKILSRCRVSWLGLCNPWLLLDVLLSSFPEISMNISKQRGRAATHFWKIMYVHNLLDPSLLSRSLQVLILLQIT